MNELEFKKMSKYSKINRQMKLSNSLRIVAVACLFFSIAYCQGTKNIENIDKSQAIVTNIVWFISMAVLVLLYIKDSKLVKNNKTLEFDIYKMEVEDLEDKKEIARITGEILSDSVLNKQIDVPDDKVFLPIVFYCILLLVDIIVRISLIGII